MEISWGGGGGGIKIAIKKIHYFNSFFLFFRKLSSIPLRNTLKIPF